MKRLSALTTIFFLTLIIFQAPAFAAIPLPMQSTHSNIEAAQHTLKNQTVKKKGSFFKKIFKNADKEHLWASIIMAILIPFVGVAIWQDGITMDFLITFILTLLLYVPGLIYALSLILR
jgi:uncharacterized membrane protein YqaE (UPF0057 family)